MIVLKMYHLPMNINYEEKNETIRDIIITWYLKLFCSAVPPTHTHQKCTNYIRKHVQQNLWGQHLEIFKELKQNISRAL